MPDDGPYSGPYGAVQWAWDRFIGADGHINPNLPYTGSPYYVSFREFGYLEKPTVIRVVPVAARATPLLVLVVVAADQGVTRPRYAEYPHLPRDVGGALDALDAALGGRAGGVEAEVRRLVREGVLDGGGESGIGVFVLPTWRSDP